MTTAPDRCDGLFTLAAVVSVPAGGAATLVAGLAGILPATLAVALAVGASTACCAALIIRRVLGTGRRRVRKPARLGAGLLGAGVLVGGLSVAGGGVADQLAPGAMAGDVPLPAEIPLVGLFFTVGGYLLGLLLLPGGAASFAGRLRRALDAVGIGVSVFFIAWLLLFDRAGLRGAGLTAVLLGSLAVAVAGVSSVRAPGHRSPVLACAAGVALSITGLTGLAVSLDYAATPRWVAASGALLLGGPILIWRGVRIMAEGSPPVEPVDGDDGYAGYPLLAPPVAAAVVAAAYHLVQRRPFDATSILLGIIVVTVIAVRETLGALDVRRYAERLAAQQRRFRSLFAGSTEVAVVVDAELVVRWQSSAAARQFGLSDQDVVGRPLRALVHPDDAERVTTQLAGLLAEDSGDLARNTEVRFRDGFGTWREVELRIGDRRLATSSGELVLHIRDVGERKELERTLYRAASTDRLTTLPNRQELRRALAAWDCPGVLMVLCLDGVAAVNDGYGREVGEAALVEAARRLREGLRRGDLPGPPEHDAAGHTARPARDAGPARSDLPARLDGETFAVLTGGGAVQAHLLATRLLTALCEPYPMPGATVHLSARVGLAELDGSLDGDEVLRRAELALRRAKRRGRGATVEWYDEAAEATLRRLLAIEQDLPAAIRRGALDLLYQPVVELATNRPVGAETVLRWRHPTQGVISSDELLPIAAGLGVLDELGNWTLHQVCRQLAGWLRDGYDLWVSVDVTAEQLATTRLAAQVRAALEAHPVPPSRLMFEIAEPGLTEGPDPGASGTARYGSASDRYPAGEDGDAPGSARERGSEIVLARLAELRSLGVRVAVDRFGAASTSLSQLRVLPIDLLKVDRRLFAEPSDRNTPDADVIDVVVRFGQQLGVEVAAQGLDTESDLEVVRAAGCRFGQGDLLSRPVPPEYLEAYVDSHRSQMFS